MTLTQIHDEIERASERRSQLYRLLSEGHDPATAAELRTLDARLEELWNQHRALRAKLRFGDPEQIVKRARLEERLERAA
jgi:ABC-type phosphate transport system auxiliary subunit